MTISLYDATIPSWIQILGSVARLIDKAEAFAAEHGLAPAEIIAARFAPDMLPFAYQVKSTAVHSLGAIEGVRAGRFSPDESTPPDSFAGLRDRIATTGAALDAIDPAEIESFIGRDMRFVMGDRQIDYFAEHFLLSFSLPNFYFHAATAYDLLRWKGVAIGKRDYIGRVRKKD